MKMVSLLPLLPPVQFLTNLLAWYNFARKHETLKGRTPATASGRTERVWTSEELIGRAAE
jgi:hypothetical protein